MSDVNGDGYNNYVMNGGGSWSNGGGTNRNAENERNFKMRVTIIIIAMLLPFWGFHDYKINELVWHICLLIIALQLTAFQRDTSRIKNLTNIIWYLIDKPKLSEIKQDLRWPGEELLYINLCYFYWGSYKIITDGA